MMYDQKKFQSPVLLWSESEFQAHVVKLARQLGFSLIYHTHDARKSPAGFPDLVMINSKTRRVLHVELKAMAGRLSADQEQWIDGYRSAGLFAEVWRPSDWVSGRILQVLRGGAVSARA